MDGTGRMKNRRILLVALAVVAVGAIAFFWTQSAMGVSADQMRRAEDQMRRAESDCIRWFNRDRDLGGRDPFSSDVWGKDGSVVVEVGFDKRGSSYSTRLCVYDLDSNRMSAPNNFTRSRWEN